MAVVAIALASGYRVEKRSTTLGYLEENKCSTSPLMTLIS